MNHAEARAREAASANTDVWINIVLLIIYSAVVFAAAVWRFRKKVA
jgi:ABC-type transport system involved in multi-copper enzyme maturation permease subunit